MDRQHEHQKHRQEERGYNKDERKKHEHAQEQKVRTIHPVWFVVLGVILVGGAVMLCTFMFP